MTKVLSIAVVAASIALLPLAHANARYPGCSTRDSLEDCSKQSYKKGFEDAKHKAKEACMLMTGDAQSECETQMMMIEDD